MLKLLHLAVFSRLPSLQTNDLRVMSASLVPTHPDAPSLQCDHHVRLACTDTRCRLGPPSRHWHPPAARHTRCLEREIFKIRGGTSTTVTVVALLVVALAGKSLSTKTRPGMGPGSLARASFRVVRSFHGAPRAASEPYTMYWETGRS